MGISSLIYDSWMREAQFKKYSGICPMLKDVDMDGKILDVGIGTGLFEEYMKGLGVKMDVKGLELDSRMATEARKRGYDVVIGNAEALPFEDESFDFVLCIDSINAIKKKEQAIKEMVRVLKPQKLLLVSMFCNIFTKNQVIAKLDSLTSGMEVLSKKIVGNPNDELAIAFLIKKPAVQTPSF